MEKEECIELFERYIQNRANPDEIKRLSFWIKNNQEISLWLEQQILDSVSSIESEVQIRMLRNIEAEINANYNEGTNKQLNIRFRLNKWMRVAAMFILPIFTASLGDTACSRCRHRLAPARSDPSPPPPRPRSVPGGPSTASPAPTVEGASQSRGPSGGSGASAVVLRTSGLIRTVYRNVSCDGAPKSDRLLGHTPFLV